MNLREKLIVLSMIKAGDWFSMHQTLIEDQKLSNIKNKAYLNQLENEKINVLTILDEAYPETLKEMVMPPFVLYYRGNLNLLKKNAIAIVGGRQASGYGLKFCHQITSQLMAKNCMIVSGELSQIELRAKEISEKKKQSIQFLSKGFQFQLLKFNESNKIQEDDENLILTEYPPGKEFSWRQYFRSQRIYQAFSQILLVIEISDEDKRLSNLKQIIHDGKPTFILPDQLINASAKGGLSLMNEGAYCFIDVDQMLNILDK